MRQITINEVTVNIIDEDGNKWSVKIGINNTIFDVILKGRRKYNNSSSLLYMKNVIQKNIIDINKQLIPMKQPIKKLFDVTSNKPFVIYTM